MLPAPTAPSEGSAGVRNLVHFGLSAQPDPLSILAHQLRRRIPPNRSLLRGARPTYSTAPPGGSLVFRPSRPGVWDRNPSKPKPSSVPRPFLGRPLSRPASLTDDPKTVRNRVALEKDNSSGASSRLAPARTEALPIACRRRSDLWSPAASSCRCRLLERPGPPSRSPLNHALPRRVAKAKNGRTILWITGISGTISGTFSNSPNHRRFGCCCGLLRLPPKRA